MVKAFEPNEPGEQPPIIFPMTREEIQELRSALLKARNSPCDCPMVAVMGMVAGKITKREAQQHIMQCAQGERMYDAAIEALDCVLGVAEKTCATLRIRDACREGEI